MPFADSGNHDSLVGDNNIKSAFQLQKGKLVDRVRGRYPHHDNMQRGFEDVSPSVTFRMENQLVIPQVKNHDEGTCLCMMYKISVCRTLLKGEAFGWSPCYGTVSMILSVLLFMLRSRMNSFIDGNLSAISICFL